MNTYELLNTKVKEAMTTELITVLETDLLARVDSLLQTHNINHIPIVDEEGNLKGIVTKNDLLLLKDWGTNLKLKSSENLNAQLLNSHIAKDRMNSTLMTVKPDDTLEYCASIFRENLFHALPVTVDGKLVGIITTYDLLNVAYNSVPNQN